MKEKEQTGWQRSCFPHFCFVVGNILWESPHQKQTKMCNKKGVVWENEQCNKKGVVWENEKGCGL